MRIIPQNIGTLHFIGIGGIGMSGIAEVLHSMGYQVQGSDAAEGYNLDRLRKQGIPVFVGHDASHVDDAALVVVSSAIKSDNPELIAARAKKIPVVRRAEMLAELMRLKMAVAVAGTHGKTTTTSMVGAMLEEGEFDPTVINGGIVHKYGTNTRMGASEWMVVEADESDGTFTKLPATVAVVTNIDPEHLDHYGDYAAIKSAFKTFIENIPFYGFAVLCVDHPAVQAMIPDLSDRVVMTYGFNPQADVHAHTVRHAPNGSTFDVTFSANVCGEAFELKDVFLPMLGQHNVQNALSALAIGARLKMTPEQMRAGLANFSGVKRRFTKTGEVSGITVIDDYGHHPVEIRAVLKAARQAIDGTHGARIFAVVQPHRYTRLSSLMNEFCTCMNDADTVFVADVYAAGETPIEGANKEALAAGISAHGHKDVRVLPSSDDLAGVIAREARAGDYVICLGAGDITKWAYALPSQLESLLVCVDKQRA